MAFEQTKKVNKWNVDTGNEKRKQEVQGLRDDRALVVIRNNDQGLPEVAHMIDSAGVSREMRATGGVTGSINDLRTKKIDGEYPRRLMQLFLYDQPLDTHELLDLGNIKSSAARTLVSCLRGVEGPLYGRTLTVKTYRKQVGKKVYTNLVVMLDGVELEWAYQPEFLNANYPEKPLLNEEKEFVLDIDGTPMTIRDKFWLDELQKLMDQITSEREKANSSSAKSTLVAAAPANEDTTDDDDSSPEGDDDLPF